MSEIVKGWVSEHFEVAFKDHGIGVARRPMQASDILVSLVPDDGTYKVVTVEEWERRWKDGYITAAKMYDEGIDPDFSDERWEIEASSYLPPILGEPTEGGDE